MGRFGSLGLSSLILWDVRDATQNTIATIGTEVDITTRSAIVRPHPHLHVEYRIVPMARMSSPAVGMLSYPAPSTFKTAVFTAVNYSRSVRKHSYYGKLWSAKLTPRNEPKVECLADPAVPLETIIILKSVHETQFYFFISRNRALKTNAKNVDI